MDRKRMVIAGIRDAGILTAIRLWRHTDVVGISVKPGLVSGQELGVRLSRPHDWARDYWIPFDRFRRLDEVRIIQATLTGVDLAAHTVLGRGEDGAAIAEEYDAKRAGVGVHPGHRAVFAIGDAAATDPLRSSTRNRGDALVARNVRAEFTGARLRHYRAPARRWGSLVDIQPDGLEVFFPTGDAFRFPSWSVDRVVMPWIVRCGMYRGVRENKPLG